jgi:hypothetical protein
MSREKGGGVDLEYLTFGISSSSLEVGEGGLDRLPVRFGGEYTINADDCAVGALTA